MFKIFFIGILLCVIAALVIGMGVDSQPTAIPLMNQDVSQKTLSTSARKIMHQFTQKNAIITLGGEPALFDSLESEISLINTAYVGTAKYITGRHNFFFDLHVVK